jgi:hypothetical protein
MTVSLNEIQRRMVPVTSDGAFVRVVSPHDNTQINADSMTLKPDKPARGSKAKVTSGS